MSVPKTSRAWLHVFLPMTILMVTRFRAELQEAVALLPDVQRTVFTLKYYDNMKYSEMSKVLSTSEGALKASYHLAVKKITDLTKLNKTNRVFV